MKNKNWFAVNRRGLAALVERRGLGPLIAELIQNAWAEKQPSNLAVEKRQCWFLLESEPSPGNPDQFRVCLVTENEPGYQATGHGEGDEAVEPWYWDHETCRIKNEQRGLSSEDVDKIVASSMFCHA